MLKQAIRKIVPPRFWAAMRVWKLRRQVKTFKPVVVRHTYGGLPLSVQLADPLGQGWYDHDWEVPAEFAVLGKGKLRPGALVFDLGAHQGVVALMLANQVGEKGRVIAVEAMPHNARIAEKNVQLNDLKWVTIINAGISDTAGFLEFSEGFNSQAMAGKSRSGGIKIPAVTIDALTEQYGIPDVLFIDVEGFECHALRGARKTLESRPDLFVEVHLGFGLEQFGGSVDQILAFFSDREYEFFMASEAEKEFRPFDRTHPMTSKRFFLIARSKAGQ